MEVKIYNKLHGDAVKIREEVFIAEQGFQNELDETDNIAAHIVIYDDIPIGTCRVFTDDSGKYIIGRIAVIKKYRSLGIGKRLMSEAEEYVKSKNGTSLCLHAQCRVVEFYEKVGYVPFGDIDDDEGVPHIWMRKIF